MVSEDFIPDDKDKQLAGLVDALMSTTIGKNRKAILTPKQAVAIARARTFATIAFVPALDGLCDVLADTTVSVKGKGLEQLVKILSSRVALSGDDDRLNRLRNRLMG